MRGQGLLGGALRGDRDANGQRRGLGHERPVGEARELDEPDAVGNGVDARQRLDGQARLAATARADQREQADAVEQAKDLAALALAPDERRQRLRQIAAPAGRRLGSEQLAVQAAGLGIGLGRELGVELLAQQLVLGQRLLAAAAGRVDAHERAVGAFRQRVEDQRALQHRDGLRIVGVQLGQLDAQAAVELEQRGPARVGPWLVAVLGQQLARVEVQRALVGGDLARLARVRCGGFEGDDVDLRPPARPRRR